MKKKIIKFFGIVTAVPLLMSSCIIATSHQVTGNPVGTKEGFSKAKYGMGDDNDAGISAAAKNGGITKIATVDIKVYSDGSVKTIVTGE
jgi:hypothetical protein